MTDDLVKRLRNPKFSMRPTLSDGRKAADRIEALEAALAKADELVEWIERTMEVVQEGYPNTAIEMVARSIQYVNAYRMSSEACSDG